MIHHFPDAAAKQIVVTIDQLPVILHTAGADAHCVGIFAEEIRPVIQLFFPSCMGGNLRHLCDGRIHFTSHVIGMPDGMNDALIMNRQIGMLLDPCVHTVRIAIAARLVAKAPHDDGSMRPVPVIDPADPVKVAGRPLRVVGDEAEHRRKRHGLGTVGLQICFVHNVDTVFIRTFQKQRIRRIVAGTDRVDVELFAKKNVSFNFVRAHGIAVFCAGVMMVDAVQLDLPPVYKEYISLDLHLFETNAQLYAAVFRFNIKVI